MDTQQALLKAVLATPDDDLPRLVYADWLEENRQPERAEFIRVQVELAKGMPPAADPNESLGESLRLVREWGEREELLRRRGRGLFNTDWDRTAKWFVPVGYRTVNHLGPGASVSKISSIVIGPNGSHGVPMYQIELGIQRGFVAEVSAPLAVLWGEECQTCEGRRSGYTFESPTALVACPDCRGTGRTSGVFAELVRSQPVERVLVSDREPWSDGPGSTWFSWVNALSAPIVAAPHYLPHSLFTRLKRNPKCPSGLETSMRYPSLHDAQTALSAALLARAKG